MVKIEIDLTEEINKTIEKEVEKRLDEIGLLSFIKRVIKREFESSGCKKQLMRHETSLNSLRRKLIKNGKKL